MSTDVKIRRIIGPGYRAGAGWGKQFFSGIAWREIAKKYKISAQEQERMAPAFELAN